jgi:hypothetical protein
LSFGQFEGFFLDTCILLPHPLESMMKACSDFLNEAASQCIISSSVKTEALELIEHSHNVIVTFIHDPLKSYLESKGIKELGNRDGKIIADFFSEQKAQLRKLPYKRSNIQNEILGAVENYVASQLHSLKEGKKLPTSIFLPALAAELAIVKHKMEAPFKGGIRCEEIQPDDSVVSALVLCTIMRNYKDAHHLASALQYQFRRNKWVIFVTTDQNDILDKDTELKEIFLQCSRPEWALDFRREVTKNKAPLEHVQDIKSYTGKQSQILDAMKKAVTT